MNSEQRVRIDNVTRGTCLGASARVARSIGSRMVGLLRTPESELGDGMLIEGTQSIHMFFMRYPIDAVFIDASGRVTRTVADLRPWQAVWWAAGARDCLELPAGRIARTGTRVGDRLELTTTQ